MRVTIRGIGFDDIFTMFTKLSTPENISGIVSDLRRLSGLSYAKAAKECGVSPSVLYNVCTGKSSPNLQTYTAIVMKLCEVIATEEKAKKTI